MKAFIFTLLSIAPLCAEELPTCEMAGKWIGPNGEFAVGEECEMPSEKSKCKAFQKANEMILDCEGAESEKFHRYNEIVHK